MSKLRKGITSGRDQRAPDLINEETCTPLIQGFLNLCNVKEDHLLQRMTAWA